MILFQFQVTHPVVYLAIKQKTFFNDIFQTKINLSITKASISKKKLNEKLPY